MKLCPNIEALHYQLFHTQVTIGYLVFGDFPAMGATLFFPKRCLGHAKAYSPRKPPLDHELSRLLGGGRCELWTRTLGIQASKPLQGRLLGFRV